MNETNVDNLLEKWYEAKQQINDLESKIDKYKRIAENIMEHKNVETLMNDKFTLHKKDINKNGGYNPQRMSSNRMTGEATTKDSE